MQLRLIPKKVFKKTRLYTKCPSCRKYIVLDELVFTENPKNIECICGKKYIILSINSKNRFIELIIMKDISNGQL